jgi:prepilin-type N-terminal cleavage/methylation domain-containing protein
MRSRLTLGHHGFSLLEVMIALIIGSIGLSAIARVFSAGGRSLGNSKRMTEATLAGQEKIEQLKALSLSDAALAAGNHQDTTSASGATYVRLWTVQDNTPISGMKRIRMRVMHANEDTTGAAEVTAVLGRK